MSSRDRIRDASGYIYVVRFSNDTIKVGCATNLKSRLRQHETNARVMGHSVVETWASSAHVNFRANERLLLEKLRMVATNVSGEYFRDVLFADAVRLASGLEFTADTPELLAARVASAQHTSDVLTNAIWGADGVARIKAIVAAPRVQQSPPAMPPPPKLAPGDPESGRMYTADEVMVALSDLADSVIFPLFQRLPAHDVYPLMWRVLEVAHKHTGFNARQQRESLDRTEGRTPESADGETK